MASALYGVARSTLDADIVADIRLEQVRELVAALGEDFYADDEMISGAIEHRSSFNLDPPHYDVQGGCFYPQRSPV